MAATNGRARNAAGTTQPAASNHAPQMPANMPLAIIWDLDTAEYGVRGDYPAYVNGVEIGRGRDAWDAAMRLIEQMPEGSVVAMLWNVRPAGFQAQPGFAPWDYLTDVSQARGQENDLQVLKRMFKDDELRAVVLRKHLMLVLPRTPDGRDLTKEFPGYEPKWPPKVPHP
jgi:hypothetical protein